MGDSRKVSRVVWPTVIGVTTLVIWGFSLTPAETSAQQSGFVRQLLLALLGEGALAAADRTAEELLSGALNYGTTK